MSNDVPVWKYLTENTTDVPKDTGKQDGYVLLLVLLSIFIGGTLVLLSGLLVICRRCCEGDRRYSRASDDPEKTNTTYLEDLQPTQEITIKVDESDCLSSSSCHDNETECFLSTAATGRRVSFNEASLFDQGRKTQEKGRRYTLTEGDFHHLKNARLTHLHLPPPTLKIVTIHECESSENTIATATRPASRSSLSIFQPSVCPLPQTALTSLAVSPSSALPGDALNSVVDTSFTEKPPSPRADPPRPSTIEVMGAGSWNGGGPLGMGEGASAAPGATFSSGAAGGQGTMLQFFTKLRRHASLEAPAPTSRSRSGSSTAARGLPAWTPEGLPRDASSSGRGQPARAWTRRSTRPTTSTSSSTSPARTTWRTAPPAPAPACCRPHPRHHPPSAG